MLYGFSVTPLAENELEARVEDIIVQVKRGVFLMPLFSMSLVPEGVPVWNKAEKYLEIYRRYRQPLEAAGVRCAVLIQSSLGHGYTLTKAPFQTVVNFSDGASVNAYCPLDGGLREYLCTALRAVAGEHPAAIMLDDDFRLMMRPGRGCACPLHMAEFNRRAGKKMTREELNGHIRAKGVHDPLARLFAEVQGDSLTELARLLRTSIDEVDPSIQGINCTSGQICENVDRTNKAFAGEGNPTVVRVPNGCYAPLTVRGFSDGMAMAAICSARLKKRGIDIILAETDTIPFNRYAKSARFLHAHYLASIMEGLKGAKHWLTRTSAYEPSSGKAYRDILAANRLFYERAAELSELWVPVGACSYFTEQRDFNFNAASWMEMTFHNEYYWVSKNLERMGLPFYFSDEPGRLNLLEGNAARVMTEEQIEALLHRSVICDGTSARILTERGFAHRLGVRAEEWDLDTPTAESFDGTADQCCSVQKRAVKLTPTDPRTGILTVNVRRQDGYARHLAPASTRLDKTGGGFAAVFCGSPNADFNYMEGFAFLNESRKAQLVELMRDAGALPVYLHGDDEVCLRAGYLPDGRLLTVLYPLGTDPLEQIPLWLEKEPRAISLVASDGTDQPLEFTPAGEGVYLIRHRAEIMSPVMLLIE